MTDIAADQLETLARAICAADGRDPDAPVPGPDGDVPQWRAYEVQARRIIAAQLAL